MSFDNLSKHPRLLTTIALSIFLISSAAGIQAQTPTPTPIPKSPEEIEQERRIRELNNANTILELEKKNKELQKEEPGKSEAEKRFEEQKKELENQKAILDLQNGINSAQSAKFPASTATPLAGTTTVSDGAVIESQMITYNALGKSANRIIEGIKKSPNDPALNITHLAIFNDRDINLLLSYKVTNNQIEIMRKGYCNFLNPSKYERLCAEPDPMDRMAPLLPLTIAKSFLGAFVDMTALLRTNVEIKGNTFDIDEGPLVAEVFRAGRRDNTGFGPNVQLYYPAMFAPDVDPNGTSDLLTRIDALNSIRVTVGNILGSVEELTKKVEEAEGKVKTLKTSVEEQIPAQIKALETKQADFLKAHCPTTPYVSTPDQRKITPCSSMPPDAQIVFGQMGTDLGTLDSALAEQTKKFNTAKTEEAAAKQRLQESWARLKFDEDVKNPSKLTMEDLIAQLKARNAQFDKFLESIVAPNTATGMNALTTYIKAENLRRALPSNSYWLQLKVLKAGGNNRIKTNLIWDIFTGGNRLSHSGGVVVQYILFDDTGRVAASDTITEYINYIKSDKVKNLPNVDIDDCTPFVTKSGQSTKKCK